MCSPARRSSSLPKYAEERASEGRMAGPAERSGLLPFSRVCDLSIAGLKKPVQLNTAQKCSY